MKIRALMQLLFAISTAALWLSFGAMPAAADNGPHVSTAGQLTDRCAGCHRLHSAQAAYVLVEEEPALCYTCHGSAAPGASTDVVDGLGFATTGRTGTPGALRGGGFQYALIDAANPSGQNNFRSNVDGTVPVLPPSSGTAVTSTHSVDGSDGVAWGNGAVNSGAGATIQLRCTSCHDPHGGANAGAATYRILRPRPDQSGATADVAIADATTKVYTTANYWEAWDSNNMISESPFVLPSAWCSQCHTRYRAAAGAGGKFPSADAIYKYRHRSNDDGPGTPTCIQCHVAHGSNATMGPYSGALANPGGTPATAGDSRLLRIDNRGTCQMCHNR